MARLLLEPEAPADLTDALTERGFSAVGPTQPQHARILQRRRPDERRNTFKHGRRYNIRAGLRRGGVVKEGKDATELARQSAAVERRESINLPDRSYYELLLELLPWCRTYTAYGQEHADALATVLVARHGGRAYSLFAGRSGAHPELMGNDLAWGAGIRSAAGAGSRGFDCWGGPPPSRMAPRCERPTAGRKRSARWSIRTPPSFSSRSPSPTVPASTSAASSGRWIPRCL